MKSEMSRSVWYLRSEKVLSAVRENALLTILSTLLCEILRSVGTLSLAEATIAEAAACTRRSCSFAVAFLMRRLTTTRLPVELVADQRLEMCR